MNDATKGTRAHVNFVRVTDREGERHLLLVTTESSLRDRTLQSSAPGQLTSLTDAKIQIKAHYLDGSLLQKHGVGGLVGEFAGKLETGWITGAEAWRHHVRLSNGFVLIEQLKLRNLGLGTYFFAQVVLWARQVAPQGDVQAIKLSVHQARDAEARDRRNAFYERFGFTFEYRTVNGIDRAEGSSLPISVSDLTIPNISERIEVLPLQKFLEKHFDDLREERDYVASEVQRYERVVKDHITMCRETNWIVDLGRLVYRFCR